MKHLLCIILLLSSMNLWAQDVIINKDGDAIKVWGLEVSNTSIFYRESQASDAPIKRLDKKDVLMIKYQDGRREMIGDNNSAQPTSTTHNAVINNEVRANAANSERIAAYNGTDVKWLETPKSKKYDIFSYCRLKVKDESVLETDDVSIFLNTGELDNKGQYRNNPQSIINQLMTITVRNKTDRTLFLDLGNTFFVRGGEAEPYYIPTATSEYEGKTTGGSLNLGAVTGALGVGGAAGTLANGINVSESNISGTKTTVYSQRIISIPPNSSKTLPSQLLIPEGFASIPWLTGYAKMIVTSVDDYKQGDIAHWNAINSPLTFSFFLSFDYDEACANLKRMKVDLYLADMYAIYTNKPEMPNRLKAMEGRIENWKNSSLHFFMRNFGINFVTKSYTKRISTTKDQLGGNWESVAK